MAVLLSIETSTPTSSIALHEDGRLMASIHVHLIKSHSEYLVPSIRHLLEVCSIDMSAVNGIAISKGPGSYTGLRIGTATAKGLCYGTGIPLIAINTLEAMAFGVAQFHDEDVLLCPMIDARRMEVYCLITDKNRRIIQPTQAVIVDENSFTKQLSEGRMVFFGNGASKCRQALKHQPFATFLDDIYPDAVQIGALAWHKFLIDSFEDIATFEPFYLKDFIAKKPSATKLV